MLPRSLTLAIIAFWLLVNGWFFYRDVWPYLRPGEPPSYVIDLADEARSFPTRWLIYQDTRRRSDTLQVAGTIGAAARGPVPALGAWFVPLDQLMTRAGEVLTYVRYRDADDSFELHAEYRRLALRFDLGLGEVRLTKMTSMYCVTRGGEVQEVSAEVEADLRVLGQRQEVLVHFNGDVRGAKFHPRCQVELRGVAKHDLPLEPIDVAGRSSFLNPMQPVNRIGGLRRGQTWRMPLVDLAKAPAGALPGSGSTLRVLQAEVQRESRALPWRNREERCLVIEYQSLPPDGGQVVARTWVRVMDGMVLRQEAFYGHEHLVLQRD